MILTDLSQDDKVSAAEDALANFIEILYTGIDANSDDLLEKQELLDGGYNIDTIDVIMNEYDIDSNGLSLLEFAEQYHTFSRSSDSKCTYQEVLDPNENDITKCNSLTDCASRGADGNYFADNEKCTNEYESCGILKRSDRDNPYYICVLTTYCGESYEKFSWGED